MYGDGEVCACLSNLSEKYVLPILSKYDSCDLSLFPSCLFLVKRSVYWLDFKKFCKEPGYLEFRPSAQLLAV